LLKMFLLSVEVDDVAGLAAAVTIHLELLEQRMRHKVFFYTQQTLCTIQSLYGSFPTIISVSLHLFVSIINNEVKNLNEILLKCWSEFIRLSKRDTRRLEYNVKFIFEPQSKS
jgi:hypothetical protein